MISFSEIPTTHPEGLLCSRASSNSDVRGQGHQGHGKGHKGHKVHKGHKGHKSHEGHKGHKGPKGHQGHEDHGGIEGQELPRRLQGGQGEVGPLSTIHNNRHFILAIGRLQN